MADKEAKREDNVPGRYYVDEECTGCGVCAETAPENFKLDDEGLAFVGKQPANDEEEEACQEAKECCPADAIGDDGED